MHCWYIYRRGSGNKRRKFGSLCGVCFIHGIILLSHKTKIVVLQWHFLFIQYMHYIQYTEVYIVYIYLCSIGTKKTFSERVILSGGSSQGPLKQLGKSFLQLYLLSCFVCSNELVKLSSSSTTTTKYFFLLGKIIHYTFIYAKKKLLNNLSFEEILFKQQFLIMQSK